MQTHYTSVTLKLCVLRSHALGLCIRTEPLSGPCKNNIKIRKKWTILRSCRSRSSILTSHDFLSYCQNIYNDKKRNWRSLTFTSCVTSSRQRRYLSVTTRICFTTVCVPSWRSNTTDRRARDRRQLPLFLLKRTVFIWLHHSPLPPPPSTPFSLQTSTCWNICTKIYIDHPRYRFVHPLIEATWNQPFSRKTVRCSLQLRC